MGLINYEIKSKIIDQIGVRLPKFHRLHEREHFEVGPQLGFYGVSYAIYIGWSMDDSICVNLIAGSVECSLICFFSVGDPDFIEKVVNQVREEPI